MQEICSRFALLSNQIKMLGKFVTNILVAVLGYVYPALDCFKTIERSTENHIHGLRFWCQYWVIVAYLTAIERFGDIFISWLPLYGEFKLAFFVYLWHPKTMGTYHVYGALLRPFMRQHETDIENRLQFIVSKCLDVFLFYIKNFADKGQSMAFGILQYVISLPSSRSSPSNVQNGRNEDERPLPGNGRQMPRPPTGPPSPPPSAPPLYQPIPSSRHRRSSPTRYRTNATRHPRAPLYPTIDGDDGVKRVEEALRAAGVNLRKLRPQ